MNHQEQINRWFADFTGSVPGAVVMVIKESKPAFANAYGLANLENKTPCTTNTNFRLASITKQFTAVSVLILAEQQRLALEDPIVKFFPEFPEYGGAITVRHLLAHTSGVLDYEELIPKGTTLAVRDSEVLALLCRQETTAFPPGMKFSYSNSGYALLALIVEVASGRTFPSFLRTEIFEPAGMSSSIAYVSGLSRVADRAFGYAKTSDGFVFSDQSLTSSVLGDGGIYSSVTDLLRWDQFLNSNDFPAPKLLREAMSAQSLQTDMPGSGYGYGWYVGKHRDTRKVWHYGSTCGFSTHLERYPDQKLTVIILANRRDADLRSIAEKLTDLFWAEKTAGHE